LQAGCRRQLGFESLFGLLIGGITRGVDAARWQGRVVAVRPPDA
jgi:hypothetical protein